MGLAGSGKTYLATRLQKHLDCAWYNADEVREMSNDWDFSDEGRLRQSQRMKSLADFEKSHGKIVICDFICPTEETRKSFDGDYLIFMDTIKESHYEDTNNIFQRPKVVDKKITSHLSDDEIQKLAEAIKCEL